MLAESTRETMRCYLLALLERGAQDRYLADDVALALAGTDVQASGREAVIGLTRQLHEEAFDAAPELKSLVCEDGRAAVEAVLVGRHKGDFAGAPPNGREVCVPYAAMYALEGDRISEIRIYRSAHLFLDRIRTVCQETEGSPAQTWRISGCVWETR